MTLYDMTKKYGSGKGEPMMWDVIAVVSDAVDSSMPEAEKHALERKIYGKLSEGHYNEQYAVEDVAKMNYRDPRTGMVRKAPYWTAETIRGIYESLKADMRGYNCWDFYVALNNTKADNCVLFRSWWPDADMEVLTQKIAEATVNWLNDEDAPQGEGRVWRYFNG